MNFKIKIRIIGILIEELLKLARWNNFFSLKTWNTVLDKALELGPGDVSKTQKFPISEIS